MRPATVKKRNRERQNARTSAGIPLGGDCRKVSARRAARGRARHAHPHAQSKGFSRDILGRPKNERSFTVIPVGYLAQAATAPRITNKNLEEVMLAAEPAEAK